MTFPLKDIRYSVRRSPDAGEMTLYPRLLRDRAILPKIDMAIRYFESMLGRERREFESEVLVHFFGDHKLARSLVACMARSYRYRPPALEEVLSARSMHRLHAAGLASPAALRLCLFDHLNAVSAGYAPRVERAGLLALLELQLGLRDGELDRALWLDAEEHARLERVGGEPRPEDVRAQFNFATLETLLRHAEWVELELAEPVSGIRHILQLCRLYGVRLQYGGEHANRVRLLGVQDALGNWARHGRFLARTIVQVLERERGLVAGGRASLGLRERRGTVRLTPEVLDILSGAPGRDAGWEDEPGWEPMTVLEQLASAPAQWRPWRARKWPDPQAWSGGVLAPELLLTNGGTRLLLCPVRSLDHARRLASVAQDATDGDPVIFVGPEAALAPLNAVGARVIACQRFNPAQILSQLPQALDPALPTPSARAAAS